MNFVRPAHRGSIDRILVALRATEPTYADVGATLTGQRPIGFRHDSYQAELGQGAGAFGRAVQGLRSWQAHRLPGVRVFPDEAEIQCGVTVLVTFGTPLLALAAPCRVVEVIDEPDRWGFAYGTLPGHPEQGEEAFVVSVTTEGSVRFEITAFSRPGNTMVRLSGPLGRVLQRRGTQGYLGALRRYVAQGS
jgi:uncharacterized protein (UPF0548 family)